MNKEYRCPKCAGTFHWHTRRLTGHCFRCGFKLGGTKNFVTTFGEKPPEPGDALFKEDILPFGDMVPATESAEARGYLHQRGVAPQYLEQAGVEACYHNGAVYFPIWSPVGPVGSVSTQWMWRRIDQPGWMAQRMHKGLYVFGAKSVVKRLKSESIVYLVEGVFDLLSPRLYDSGLALLGSEMSPQLQRWIRSVANPTGTIFIWFDGDSTGKGKGRKLQEALSVWHPNVRLCNGWKDDPRDPGQYGWQEASDLITQVLFGIEEPVK